MVTHEEAETHREARGLSQDALAELIGTTRNTYTLWKGGHRKLPDNAMTALYAWVHTGKVPVQLVDLALRRIVKELREIAADLESTDIDPAIKPSLLRNRIRIIDTYARSWERTCKDDHSGA